jgi:hypothetical protein
VGLGIAVHGILHKSLSDSVHAILGQTSLINAAQIGSAVIVVVVTARIKITVQC